MVTTSFVGAFWGPRGFLIERSFACKDSGNCEKRTARAKSSFVHSGFSASIVSGFGVFLIPCPFSVVRFSQADDSHRIAANGEDKRVKLCPDETQGTEACLSVVSPGIFRCYRGLEVELRRQFKGKAAFPDVTLVLLRVERDLHAQIVNTIAVERQKILYWRGASSALAPTLAGLLRDNAQRGATRDTSLDALPR